MKKSILILCAAFALVGCNQEQGGGTTTGEQPGAGTSSTSSSTSSNEAIPNASLTNTNQGSATSPGGADTNTGSPATGGTIK